MLSTWALAFSGGAVSADPDFNAAGSKVTTSVERTIDPDFMEVGVAGAKGASSFDRVADPDLKEVGVVGANGTTSVEHTIDPDFKEVGVVGANGTTSFDRAIDSDFKEVGVVGTRGASSFERAIDPNFKEFGVAGGEETISFELVLGSKPLPGEGSDPDRWEADGGVTKPLAGFDSIESSGERGSNAQRGGGLWLASLLTSDAHPKYSLLPPASSDAH